MAFSQEPAFDHASAARTAILLINLGTPDAPTAKSVRVYLRQFLSDPRVVEIPKLVWRFLLEAVVLPLRSARSAAKYQSVWMAEGSPLKVYTERQTKLLKGSLGAAGYPLLVEYAMRYGTPSIAQVLDQLKAQGATRILVLPLYPQYSATTTATGQDAVFDWCRGVRNVPELRFVRHYHDHPAYIAALAERVRTQIAPEQRRDPLQSYAKRVLVMSFHGLPRRSLELGDPYHCECLKTGRLLAEQLKLSQEEYRITFQSRFGRAAWLEPYTEPTLVAMAQSGVAAVDVVCPGFPADCLETLEEIAIEARAAFLNAGGSDYHYIAALNDEPRWIEALHTIALENMQGWALQPKSEAVREQQKERALAAGATR